MRGGPAELSLEASWARPGKVQPELAGPDGAGSAPGSAFRS
jgi:hypothetical protein